jgi:hypothetical protein
MSSTRIGRGPERPTRRLRGSSLLSGNESITPTGLRAAGSRAASPTPSRKGLQDQLHPKCFRPRGPVRVTPDGRDLLNTGMKAGLAPFVPASSRELTERGFHWLSTRSGECRSISLPRLPQRPQKGFCVFPIFGDLLNIGGAESLSSAFGSCAAQTRRSDREGLCFI